MHDLLQSGFCEYVKSAAEAFPALSLLNYYTASHEGGFALPSLSCEAKESEPLHANTTVRTGPLTVWLECQADDTPEELHAERTNALAFILSKRKAAVAFINGLDSGLRVYGYSVQSVTYELKERRWTSCIDLEVGYRLPVSV